MILIPQDRTEIDWHRRIQCIKQNGCVCHDQDQQVLSNDKNNLPNDTQTIKIIRMHAVKHLIIIRLAQIEWADSHLVSPSVS